MSASGPLLPTLSQGDPVPPSPPPGTQEEEEVLLVTSPSSAITSPSKAASFPSKRDHEEKSVQGMAAKAPSLASKDDLLAGETENSERRREAEDEEGGEEGGTRKKEVSFHPVPPRMGKGNATQRLPSSAGGRDKSIMARDWSLALPEMFQDEGWGDGPACVESDDDGAAGGYRGGTPGGYQGGTPPTPPALRAVRWAESLQNLLSDDIGANTFRSYLQHELKSNKVLDFWYACKGLKEEETSVENTNELVLLIWKSFVRNKTVKVSSSTYKSIEERIHHKLFDSRIFDQAQAEVEKYINDPLYIAFLKSEFYLSVLQPWKREGGVESPPSPSLPSEGCCSFAPYNYLPTLHEEAEYDARGKPAVRLTSNNLLASANYRANIERIKPEANAGFYLRGTPGYKPSPYHVTYVAGHSVSLQDSELQSLSSSGAHTDDTKSCTNSSVDASSSLTDGMPPQPLTRKQLKRQNQKMRENALQNKLPPSNIISSNSGVHVIPRTMLPATSQTNFPRADRNPEEFARILCQKLERSQQNLESRERLLQSMCKITHSEEAADEARREHAVNALPPNVLLNKLNERVQMDDQGLSQSILDEHVARVWDSPVCSPSSPKQPPLGGGDSPPVREGGPKGAAGPVTRQLPHLSYPQNPLSAAMISAHLSKCALKAGRHHTSSLHSTASPATAGLYPNLPPAVVGVRGRHPNAPPSAAEVAYGGHGYQPKNGYHGRRRERGHDVYSTFSSDSGNVADYHEAGERLPPPPQLPKSKSMPEYIENHAFVATTTTSDGASSSGVGVGGRRYSGTRRCCRRTPADCTDSGVSVVSDSGRSGALSTSSERVESWLFQSRPFTCGGNTTASSHSSHSVCPTGERERERESAKEMQKARGARSTHTVAGSTSPGMQRRSGGGSTGRRSQCSSSASANTCINARPDVCRPYEQLSRDSPVGQAQTGVTGDRRKNKGGSSSSKSTGQGSSVGEGSGSNGSTLKKQQKSSKQGGTGGDPVSSASPLGIPQGGGAAPATPSSTIMPPPPPADVTTIVYSFQDDHVPFIIKVPSRPVTLKRFKQHLHKKGMFRYFFKKFCEDMGMVYEEMTEDGDVLPLFEGKVFVQIHKDD